MTDNLPARIPPPTSDELDVMVRFATMLASAESSRDTVPKHLIAAAGVRVYYARSLGLPALAASELSVINGRLVVGAQLLRTLAAMAGYRLRRILSSDQTCTARIADRNGELLGDSTFTIDEARKAGLIRPRSAWETYPARMLWARASAYVIRDFAPEVSLGLILDDEAREIRGQALPAPAADDEVEGDVPWTDAEADAYVRGDDEPDEPDEPDLEPDGLDTDDIAF
jgi:hypothetical protein